MWELDRSKKFIKQYKQLDSNTQHIVDNALADIVSSTNPSKLGAYKQNMRTFSYELGKKYHIMYSIRYDEGIVELLRVCDHKSVYGKD